MFLGISCISVRRGTPSFIHRYSPKPPQKIDGKNGTHGPRREPETRTARLRLSIRSEPYRRGLEKGFALGYRRRGKGGTWLARRRPAAGGYAEHKIGTCDDLQDADGVAILDYGQAQKSRAGMVARRAAPRGRPRYAVRSLHRRGGSRRLFEGIRGAWRQVRLSHSPGRRDSHPADARHRPGRQADGEENRGLAPRACRKPALARSKPGRKPNHRKADKSADGVRKRRATANRILTVLKAALNHAWKSGHIMSDDAWRRVRPFRAVETARVRYLSEAECVRLVNACEPSFRNLVRGALLTGCRYSELTGLHVGDFNADAGVVTVRESKAGKPRHVVLTDEGQRLFATLTAGKHGTDPIFMRTDGGLWGKSHQLRPMVDACARAKIKPAVSFHVLRHTHGSTLAMRGVPMGVIAEQLGHAGTRMTEKHYAHFAPSYVAASSSPPTVRGMKTSSAVRRTTSKVVARSSRRR